MVIVRVVDVEIKQWGGGGGVTWLGLCEHALSSESSKGVQQLLDHGTVVGAFAHGVMGLRIDPSWCTH